MSSPSLSSVESVGSTSNKYDRQIRIWGDDGQRALQSANACVIEASATATEILKNLVLPGIGSFTIVDGHKISAQDGIANFFLASSSPGQYRCEAVAKAMYDLNESVRGSYVAVNPSSFLTCVDTARQFLQSFSIVIMTQRTMLDPVTRAVSTACAELNIPLLYTRSYGQIGLLRWQLLEHCVYHSHSEDAQPDLRLHTPFPELKACVDSPNDDQSGDIDQGHVPFIYILLRALQQFRFKHDGKLPKTRDEKDEFANIVRKSKPSTCPSDAQNYVEALRFAHLRLCHAISTEIPHHVTKILNMASTRLASIDLSKPSANEQPIDKSSLPQPIRTHPERRSSFQSHPTTANSASLARQRAQWWACAFGVSQFVAQQHHLPLSGSIPDMTADTTSYIKLQRAYAACSEREAKMIKDIIAEKLGAALVSSLRGNEKTSPKALVDDQMISKFCKNVNEIRLVQTRSIVSELENPLKSEFVEAARMEGAMDESLASSCASPFYVALRAADVFEREFSRFPGSLATFKDDDISRTCALVDQMKSSFGLSPSDCPSWREPTEELVRYAGVEIHCVAAFIGGVAAQEVIKVITGQFVPVDNCTIFNMANMTSVTFAA